MTALSWLISGLALWGIVGLLVALALGLLIGRANSKGTALRRHGRPTRDTAALPVEAGDTVAESTVQVQQVTRRP